MGEAMSFRVGQEVVCVDDSDGDWSGPAIRRVLKRQNVYIIAEVIPLLGGFCGVQLVGIQCETPNGFRGERFRPIVTTNINIFTSMLAPSPKQRVDADAA